jgi:hypothetical protein
MLGIILSGSKRKSGMTLPGLRMERLELSPQGVGHGHKVESSFGVDSLFAPLGEDKSGGVLEEAVNVLPSASLEALARDLEKRSTEVEDVDGCAERKAEGAISVSFSYGVARAGFLPSKSAIGKYCRVNEVSYRSHPRVRSFADLVHGLDVPACMSIRQFYAT